MLRLRGEGRLKQRTLHLDVMLYTFLLVCLFVCNAGSVFVPFWIVEISPMYSTVDEKQDHYGDFDVDVVAKRLKLTNIGRVGSLESTYELQYSDGIKGVNYSVITQSLQREERIVRAEQEQILPYDLRGYHLPTDPKFKDQWPLFNTGQTDGPRNFDINVVPVWIQGVSGSGSTVAVIDDGVQVTHPDLSDNIDLSISFSFITNTNNPSPNIELPEYSHGTKCAGEIVMVKNNGICGTGVAYNARLGGIQFMLSDFRPTQEASALHFRSDVIQIYSNSYGPADDGFTVAGPGPDSLKAIQIGINNGRDQLGSVYVFSSGNGGANGDSCAADGFVNSIYTIGVGSADQNGLQAYYDESCSGKMATTFTFDTNQESNQVVTTFVSDECVSNFTGTSASAPLVSGVVALALEVNHGLSWRDIQYLVAYTSDSSQLIGGWVTNGGGLRVSPQFGFGAINAEAFVNRARHWEPVEEANEHKQLVLNSEVAVNKSFPFNTEFNVSSGALIKYLEHVVLTVTLDIILTASSSKCYTRDEFVVNPQVVNHSGARRGDTEITACSPSGTCSVLLPKRPRDFVNCEGYREWDFMSVHFWGEDPVGNWNLFFTFDTESGNAVIQYIAVTLHGIQKKPQDLTSSCDPLCKKPTGCSSGGGSDKCDSCREGYYRNATTMECVESCSTGACVLEGVCVFYNGTCPKFTSEESSRNNAVLIIASFAGLILMIVLCSIMITCFIKFHHLRQSGKSQQLQVTDITDDSPTVLSSPYHRFNNCT